MSEVSLKAYDRFREAERLGLKTVAKAELDTFVRSFQSLEERHLWVWANLDRLHQEGSSFNSRMRHELFEYVVFPVLFVGWQDKHTESLYWLGVFFQNLIQCKPLWDKIDNQTDQVLLGQAFQAEPQADKIRLRLLQCYSSGLDYAMHELPAGLLGVNADDLHGELNWISSVRLLDKEGRLASVLDDFEAAVRTHCR